MKKNKKIEEEFSKHDLLLPDLTQLKLEQAQLKAHRRTTKYVSRIFEALILIINKINNIENLIITRENKNGKK